MNKIKSILYHLFDYGIYPLDLKENNILVNEDTFDVQFIDLDGDETRYGDHGYTKQFSHVRENAIKSLEFMEKRLKNK